MQRQITWKRYKIWLRWRPNGKSYMVYRTAPFSMTLNDLKPRFQGQAILWRWIPPWLWDDMPLNSFKRPPYWNSTSGFHFHTSPQSTCHPVLVCEILSKSDHPWKKEMTSCRFSRCVSQPFFDAEYLINGTRYRHSFSGMLIEAFTPYSPVWWPWVT